MTLPLGQRTLRERSAQRSLVEAPPESKGFRHGLCEKPLTVRSWGTPDSITGALQCHRTATSWPLPALCPLAYLGAARAPAGGYSSTMVTLVIATGESGRSRLFRGALTMLSTTS